MSNVGKVSLVPDGSSQRQTSLPNSSNKGKKSRKRNPKKNVKIASLNAQLKMANDRITLFENENQTLTKQVNDSEEILDRNVKRIQALYDKELTDARKVGDEATKEKAKLQMEVGQLKKDLDHLKSKFDKKSKDTTALQRQVNQLETQNTTRTVDLTKTSSDRDKLSNERKDAEDEIKKLSAELEDLKRRIEQETIARVDAENLLKARNEELNFKQQLHQKEVTEMCSRRKVEIQEAEGRLQHEYEAKLKESIQELRAEYEAHLQANKDELERLYDQKAGDLKAQLKRVQANLVAKQEEMSTLSIRLEGALQISSQFVQERLALQNRIRELEKKSDDDHSRFAKMLKDRIYAPENLTATRATKKRRLNEETKSATEYDSNAVVHGDIEVLEDSPEGTLIQLKNNGDEEMARRETRRLQKSYQRPGDIFHQLAGGEGVGRGGCVIS